MLGDLIIALSRHLLVIVFHLHLTLNGSYVVMSLIQFSIPSVCFSPKYVTVLWLSHRVGFGLILRARFIVLRIRLGRAHNPPKLMLT